MCMLYVYGNQSEFVCNFWLADNVYLCDVDEVKFTVYR